MQVEIAKRGESLHAFVASVNNLLIAGMNVHVIVITLLINESFPTQVAHGAAVSSHPVTKGINIFTDTLTIVQIRNGIAAGHFPEVHHLCASGS